MDKIDLCADVSTKETGTRADVFAESRVFNEKLPLHWHSFYELEIIMGGVGTHVLNGEEYTVCKGAAYLLLPTDFHTLIATEPIRLWHLEFDEGILSDEMARKLCTNGMPKKFDLTDDALLKLQYLSSLISTECSVDGGCAVMLTECLLNILLRGFTAENQAERGQLAGIQRALHYMNLHFHENPSLSVVAAQAGFHPHYFSELFKKVTKESYIERLNALKIGYARNMLAAGFAVSEACYRSGFGSASNFLSVFKRAVGCSPAEYRRRFK